MYLFLRGAEMQPERIRAAWPEARFVARARLAPRPLGSIVASDGVDDETWGIALEVAEGTATGVSSDVVTDDGRAINAVIFPSDDADPAAVLAAARYWELPPDYVRRLARAAASRADDPNDG